MKSWKKALIEILIIVLLFSLFAEMILANTIGYGFDGSGKFKDGLDIRGEIEYSVNNLNIAGEEWEANFYNLSSAFIRFYSPTGDLFEKTLLTSNLSIIPAVSGEYWPGITLKRITNVSKFNSATFSKSNIDIQLSSLNGLLSGSMRDTLEDDRLTLSDVIIITGNDTINASLRRAGFYLSGKAENIQFDISLGQNYFVYTYTQKGDNISLKGDLQGYNFKGSIWSNGKLYTSGNPKLSGEMELKIIQNPETFYNHDAHEYDWELEIEGDDLVVEGFGFPFWSMGLLLSVIPSVIIIVYYSHKNFLRKRKNFENNSKLK
ncbi:MAG: hypothetical protein JSV09_07200 [Thermoplasmata archaeon]|nr:MAG: hypothetical protein JSV09_07200 [Thermoplasmata archaeon]